MADETGALPGPLAGAPELYPDLEPVMRAFALLSRTRPVIAGPFGATLGAIPLAEIEAYVSLFGADDVEEFVHLLATLDAAFLARQAERRGRD